MPPITLACTAQGYLTAEHEKCPGRVLPSGTCTCQCHQETEATRTRPQPAEARAVPAGRSTPVQAV